MGAGGLSVRGVSYLADAAAAGDVRRDLAVIAAELHCNAVMLIGRDPDRLVAAARDALELGLAVHLRPDPTDLPQDEMLRRLATVAGRAEVLRREHPERVTLLVGSEFSHTVPGIVPGGQSFVRLQVILRSRRVVRRRIARRLDDLLGRAAAVARRHFHGPLGYSAAAWEEVDWTAFDLVGVSLYRSARNRAGYRRRVRGLVDGHGKPFVVTEFGCGAFTGADDRGAASFRIVSWFADPPRIRGHVPRDESVQAGYLADLIGVYAAEGVHGCFVFTYRMPDFPLDADPARDLDKAGFALVVEDGGGLRRKQAFHAVARSYRALAGHPSLP